MLLQFPDYLICNFLQGTFNFDLPKVPTGIKFDVKNHVLVEVFSLI